ncbi:SET domain-containing protein [Lignipirellula cremea]|nr:SET domain-containing protein [Lignipirellula cremea]
MKKPHVSIAYTKLGRALFALKQFRKGKVIGEVLGEIVEDPDYASPYGMDLGGDFTLEPGAPFRFMNHSCDPNCELFIYEDEGDPTPADRLHVAALRTIEPGEELTIDYGWPAHYAIRCLCGTAVCRGWIVAPEELDDVDPDAARE